MVVVHCMPLFLGVEYAWYVLSKVLCLEGGGGIIITESAPNTPSRPFCRGKYGQRQLCDYRYIFL